MRASELKDLETKVSSLVKKGYNMTQNELRELETKVISLVNSGRLVSVNSACKHLIDLTSKDDRYHIMRGIIVRCSARNLEIFLNQLIINLVNATTEHLADSDDERKDLLRTDNIMQNLVTRTGVLSYLIRAYTVAELEHFTRLFKSAHLAIILSSLYNDDYDY